MVKLGTTSQQNIDFSWDRLTTLEETGGTAILSYNVQWDVGTGGYQFLNLVGYSATYDENSYSISAHIEVGKSYKVRVAAKNYWGWGVLSEVLTITAASFPEQVEMPTTAIDGATGGLRVEWVAPFDNSAAITAYLIEAQTLAGDWVSICDGSNALVIETTKCIEPMATLTDVDTFNLPLEHVV